MIATEFLRKYPDSKAVALNISELSKIKKPNKYCFGNQTKFSIFLRNNRDCKVVYPYKARKRYTVTESLQVIVSVK